MAYAGDEARAHTSVSEDLKGGQLDDQQQSSLTTDGETKVLLIIYAFGDRDAKQFDL